MSDHRPILLKVKLTTNVRCNVILARAENLNYEVNENAKIIRHNKFYDQAKISEYMSNAKEEIEHEISDALFNNDVELAVEKLNMHIDKMHRLAKTKVQVRHENISRHVKIMNDANEAFDKYTSKLKSGTELEIHIAMGAYASLRKQVTRHIMILEHQKWKQITHDHKTLWSHIDWKGKFEKLKTLKAIYTYLF